MSFLTRHRRRSRGVNSARQGATRARRRRELSRKSNPFRLGRGSEPLPLTTPAPPPGARLHRLWRLFASRRVRLDAGLLRVAADHLDLPPDIDVDALSALTQDTLRDTPLVAVVRVSAEAPRILNDASPIDAEIFALWLADFVLAQRLRWTRLCRCSRQRSRILHCETQRDADAG